MSVSIRSIGGPVLIVASVVIETAGQRDLRAELVSGMLFVCGLALALIKGNPPRTGRRQDFSVISPVGEKTQKWFPAYKACWAVLVGGLVLAAVFTTLAVYWNGFRVLGILCFFVACASLVPLGIYTYHRAYESPSMWPKR